MRSKLRYVQRQGSRADIDTYGRYRCIVSCVTDFDFSSVELSEIVRQVLESEEGLKGHFRFRVQAVKMR